MDRIYKTKYGNWIDLSHIQDLSKEIGVVSGYFLECDICSDITMIFQDKPLILFLERKILSSEIEISEHKKLANEAFNDLLNAWKKFTKQHPELQIIKPIQCNCDKNVSEGEFTCVHGNYFNLNDFK